MKMKVRNSKSQDIILIGDIFFYHHLTFKKGDGKMQT